MKTAIIFILLFAFVSPSLAELTENDIRQIRQVIREEIKPLEDRMSALETRVGNLEKQVATIETKMEEKFNAVDDKFKAIDDKLSLVQASINDKLSLIQWFIGGLVALVVAAIAIPQLLILYREKKESKGINKLREEIAELKEKKVITP